ncbi:hypothetical protein [Mesorhizobium sp. M0488]
MLGNELVRDCLEDGFLAAVPRYNVGHGVLQSFVPIVNKDGTKVKNGLSWLGVNSYLRATPNPAEDRIALCKPGAESLSLGSPVRCIDCNITHHYRPGTSEAGRGIDRYMRSEWCKRRELDVE